MQRRSGASASSAHQAAAQADRLTGLGKKSFIGELMPKFPIYTPFLSEEARAYIGRVHVQTRPALAMLEKEGLRWEGYIDIFDGGPTVEAYIDDMRGVRLSRHCRVEVRGDIGNEGSRPRWLAATTGMSRICYITGSGKPAAGSMGSGSGGGTRMGFMPLM